MKINIKQRNINIIAEIHPQHMGSIEEIQRMMLQCKIGGADYVKVQLYNSKKLFNNLDREYLEFTKNEFLKIAEYSKQIGIKLFASIFDEEKIDWCEEAGIDLFKIASRTVEDKKLCNKIISKNKKVIISLGMYDYKKNPCRSKTKILFIFIVFQNTQQISPR